MSKTVKIKVYVDTGYAGGDHEDIVEIDAEDWNRMPEQEREDYLDELAVDFRNNRISYGAYVLEDDK